MDRITVLAILEDNAELYPKYIREQTKDMMKFANNIKNVSPKSYECYKKFKADILKVCERYEKQLQKEAVATIKQATPKRK